MQIFKGLSAFPITPADGDGRVDTKALARLVTRLVDAGVDSICVLGSTGTYAYLTRAERQRAIEAAAACTAGAVPLIAGVGALRTSEAMALTRDAQQSGADGLLLAPMSYTPLTDVEVFAHYKAVAGATDLPLCVYDNPATTHFSFSVALLERLADIPNIVAAKLPQPADGDVAGDLARLRKALPPDFSIGYSGDWGGAAALSAGADAWYSVVGGVLAEPAMALARAAMAGDSDQTKRIDRAFEPFWDLLKQHGGVRVAYAIAQILSLTQAQPPLPIMPLGPAEQDRVAAALSQLR